MRSKKTRFSVFRVVIVLVAIAVLGWNVGQAGGKITLVVDVDEASFDGAPPGPLGGFSFYVGGDFADGGTFNCWGWIDEAGVGNVSQVFNIPGRGMIMTQGIEGGLLAITGGTGDFSNLRGDALQVFTGDGLDFTMEFEVKGAGF